MKKKMETLEKNGLVDTCSEASIETDYWETGSVNCKISAFAQAMLEELGEY